jgi:hypothetical protein
MARSRTLDVISSIKLKLSAIIVGAIAIATLVTRSAFASAGPSGSDP